MDARPRSWSLWRGIIALALVPLVAGLLMVAVSPTGGAVTDIGSGLVNGAVIGLIFALVQYAIDRRNQAQDQEADLRNTLNSSRELPGIDLSGRHLRGVYLWGKVLESARLERADLTAANLDRCRLGGATMTGTVLTRARLEHADLTGADLRDAHLDAAALRGADLTGARLVGADLEGADLTEATLAGADLSRTTLRSAVLEGTDLTGALLIGVRARGARLRGARLERATLQGGDFRGAHLARARLAGANLTSADLVGALLIRADLHDVEAVGLSLARADLTGCSLRGANLRSANLTGAVLMGCDLRGADLTGAQGLETVQGLASARTDASTRWPAGAAPMPGPPALHAAPLSAPLSATLSARPVPPPVPVPVPDLGATAGGDGATDAVRWVRVAATDGTDATADLARELVVELTSQQELASGGEQGARVSLPLGARPPRILRFRPPPAGPGRWGGRPGTVTVRLSGAGAPGSRVVRADLGRGRRRLGRVEVALDGRTVPAATAAGGAEPPTAVEELAARLLDRLDPRDGAPWAARAHLVRALRLWDEAPDVTRVRLDRLRPELAAALALDPRGPAVNYALGALAYNDYSAASVRDAIGHFAVCTNSTARLPAWMGGLAGLSLTGMALAHCQLYHRFGDRRPEVLAAARIQARMAVDVTEERLARRTRSTRLRRNAVEGYALARYAEAFSQHVTEADADVRRSIPLYQEAIDALGRHGLPVPAVLYNNLGYQHMTLAGLHERGPDRQGYLTARRLFEAAVGRSDDYHFGWANLGNVDRLLGDPASAESHYRRALARAAARGIDYWPGHNELARVLVELGGRDDEAARCHRTAVRLSPSAVVRADQRAAYAHSLILVGRRDEAKAVAAEGLAEVPDHAECRRALDDAAADI